MLNALHQSCRTWPPKLSIKGALRRCLLCILVKLATEVATLQLANIIDIKGERDSQTILQVEHYEREQCSPRRFDTPIFHLAVGHLSTYPQFTLRCPSREYTNLQSVLHQLTSGIARASVRDTTFLTELC